MDDPELVEITRSLAKSPDRNYLKATVQKMYKSDLFKSQMQETVLQNLSTDFSEFISNETCPLRDHNTFSSIEEFNQLDLHKILIDCNARSPNLVNAIVVLCFGQLNFEEILNSPDSKYSSQRLLAIQSQETRGDLLQAY